MYYGNGSLDSVAAGEAIALSLGILGIVLFFVSAIYIVFYIFESIGLYTMAKRRGIRYPGLAWVPIANLWIMGSLADNYMDVTELRKTKSRYILLWLNIVIMFLSLVAAILFLAPNWEIITEAANEGRFVTGAYVLNMFGAIGICLVIWVVAVIEMVFTYIALYRIFKSCQPSNAVLYLILSIFVNVSLPFILFAVRNKDEGMIPAYVNPPYGEENR